MAIFDTTTFPILRNLEEYGITAFTSFAWYTKKLPFFSKNTPNIFYKEDNQSQFICVKQFFCFPGSFVALKIDPWGGYMCRHIYTHSYMYLYIYIYRERERER